MLAFLNRDACSQDGQRSIMLGTRIASNEKLRGNRERWGTGEWGGWHFGLNYSGVPGARGRRRLRSRDLGSDPKLCGWPQKFVEELVERGVCRSKRWVLTGTSQSSMRGER
jgi:hypothetical protein